MEDEILENCLDACEESIGESFAYELGGKVYSMERLRPILRDALKMAEGRGYLRGIDEAAE